MLLIPYILTFLIGLLGLRALTHNQNTLSLPLFLCLACLIGIAESIFICFFSFVFLNQFHLPFIVGIHILEIALLFAITRKTLIPHRWSMIFSFQNIEFIGILIFCGVISGLFAKAYPYGGWDAWQVWNFKAKFLLLSGTQWKELFDPSLWRTSPHYPLALPLFNAWTWSFSNNTPSVIPLTNTVIFNILTGGLMFSGIKHFTKSKLSCLSVMLLFLVPAYVILSSNQYCDVFLGLYFLGALITLYAAQQTKEKEWLIVAALFLGLLSFTKPEGAILAGLTFLAGHFTILHGKKDRSIAMIYWISMFIAGIPTLLFLFVLSPGNQTFLNGLLSTTHPSTIIRLKTIFIFLYFEIFYINCKILWWLIFFAGLLNLNRIFHKKFFIFYSTIFAYLLIVISYYWINTYFDIAWWLRVSLNRILISLLPSIIVWITLGICSKKGTGSRPAPAK